MSSRQKRAASRANGAKSQGPITPAGIATSSMNAVRFGLFSKNLVLSNESQTKFTELGQNYFDKFQPADQVEHDLVSEMVAAKWRQQRCWLVETAVLDLAMDAKEAELAKTFSIIDEPTRLALAHRDSMPQLASIQRAESSCRRQYDLAIKTLFLLRASQTQSQISIQNEPTATPEPAPVAAKAPLQNEPTATQEPTPAASQAPLQNEPTKAAQPTLINQNNADEDEFDPGFIARLSPYLRRKLGFDEAA